MKTKRSFIHVLICSFIICFAILGCEGPEGPTGPKGPQGDQGQQGLPGDQGPTGSQGPAGEDGNANVIYSDWFYPNWNETDGVRGKRMSVSDSNFATARSEGVILFYWGTNNGSTFLLPWNTHNSNGDLVISRWVNVRGASGEAWVEVRKYGSDFTPMETEGQVSGTIYNRIRYVIIPGGVPTKMQSDFFENYNTVKKYYGLPD